MEPGAQFSGARQGVRYRGNDGRGTIMLGHPSPPGQDSLFEGYHPGFGWGNPHQHIHPESVEYGQHTQQRRHDPTQPTGQLPLPGMPEPTDPALHHLRQQNPNLNELQFEAKTNPQKVTVTDRSGNRVGKMALGYSRSDYESHEGHREVSMIGVAPNYAGKGVGEAMYDYARMKGAKIVHSDERSESGESFARRVGGPALKRTQGHGQDDYLGLNPRRDRV